MNDTAKKFLEDLKDWESSLTNCMFSLVKLEQRLKYIIEMDSITDFGIRTEAYLSILEELIDKINQTHQQIMTQQKKLNINGHLLRDDQIKKEMKEMQVNLHDEIADLENEYLVISKNATEFLKSIHHT